MVSRVLDSRDSTHWKKLKLLSEAITSGTNLVRKLTCHQRHPTSLAVMRHFQHSSQTISHYVNKLTFALASLKEEYILQPTLTNDCHPHIAENERFYPYFK
ncbi:hypothetical protein Taro_056786, partial [Colocasia esculenta]|nr:hypothetical protein [Colocasia esculenta]